MQFKQLLSEDDAVSPVIGVILMVAITVILAAVIASFVLGLGGDSDVQPNTALSFDYDATDEELTITVSSGDSLDPNEVYIRGEIGEDGDTVSVNEDLGNIFNENNLINATDTDPGADQVGIETVGGLDSDDDGITESISSGQGILISVDTDNSLGSLEATDIDVVWDTGDDSATLDGFEGPEA